MLLKIEIQQVLVWYLIEWLSVSGLGRLSRHREIWLDMMIRLQNQAILGHPGAVRLILLHR